MNIAIVTYSLMIGGIETVIFNQAKYFIKQGHDVTIIETLKKGLWINYFLENSLKVLSITPNIFFSKKRHVIKIANHLKEYEIILLHDAPFAQSILGYLPATTISIPILHSNLDSMINNAISNLGQWNKVVYVSPFLKEVLINKENISEDEITIIPNGIIIPQTKNIENSVRKKNKFIFIGRLEQVQKAVLILPDIIKKVLQKQNVEVLNIYGDGTSEEELKNRIAQLSMDKAIKIHGSLNHDNVYSVLQQHDFLLMPSFFEGHPIVLLEAMACKTIPFVSDLPGRTDFVIEHGKNGFLCKIADIDDFSSTIIEAMNRNDLGQIAENARATVIGTFSIDAMGKGYMDLIQSEKDKKLSIKRTNKVCLELLGDLPCLPIFMIRPVRKALRILHLWR